MRLRASLPIRLRQLPKIENGNGASNLVRSPGISIKNSLKATPAASDPLEKPPSETSATSEGEAEKPAMAEPDAIIKAWKEYAASLEKKKPRIYSTLINNRPVVRNDGAVLVLLNSESQRDNFSKNIKSGLVGYIQKVTGLSGIEIITEVSESMQNGKKIYTEQDKLEFLLGKNPELGKLRTRFNLDFDD